MDFRFANETEIAQWNDLILANPDNGSVFQGYEFAEQKRLSGWTPLFVIADKIALSVHEKNVPGIGKLWYIPKGPGVKTVVQMADMLPGLGKFATQHGAFVVKVEPELEKSDDATKVLLEVGLLPVRYVQPSSTIKIDLSPDIDTIIANLNQKGRHAIRRAERDGVTIKRVETNDENSREFFNLLTETAAGSFGIRQYNYYHEFWRRYAEAGLGQMFFAYVEGQVVSAAFAMVFGEKSTYKDGASVRQRTVYGASHLLQWHVIQWAKEQGSLEHDLLGAPPSSHINDESHPFYGFGRFKSSFNKEVTDYVGTFDLVIRPRQYSWWSKFGERLVKSFRYRFHHENWY